MAGLSICIFKPQDDTAVRLAEHAEKRKCVGENSNLIFYEKEIEAQTELEERNFKFINNK